MVQIRVRQHPNDFGNGKGMGKKGDKGKGQGKNNWQGWNSWQQPVDPEAKYARAVNSAKKNGIVIVTFRGLISTTRWTSVLILRDKAHKREYF